jgi:hypothetical protein
VRSLSKTRFRAGFFSYLPVPAVFTIAQWNERSKAVIETIAYLSEMNKTLIYLGDKMLL